MEKKKLVIFDFDGVLINTIQMSYELNRISNPDLTMEHMKKMSEGNFFAAFESNITAMPFKQNPVFHEQYKAKVREHDTPLPIQEAIRNLSTKHILVIVSSMSANSISHFLEKEDLLKCFDDVLGYENHKSKVVKINGLLKKYSILPENAVFVTDTLGDILEGTEAGVQSIGVTWGLHDKILLSDGKPAAIIDNPDLLQETVETILHS